MIKTPGSHHVLTTMTQLCLDILFPKRCVNCRSWGDYLCPDCLKDVDFLDKQFCPGCSESSVLGYRHPDCRRRSYFRQLYSLCWYRGPIVQLTQQLKYPPYVFSLREVIARFIQHGLLEGERMMWEQCLVVPVPLHKTKLRERGFNQAELIGIEFAAALELRLDATCLKRIRITRAQSGLETKKQRRQNVRGVFQVNPAEYLTNATQGFVIVDDIYTSGSTLEECGQVLQKKYPEYPIYAFTFARG